MTFGKAIEALKEGKKVTRKGVEWQRYVPLVETRNNG